MIVLKVAFHDGKKTEIKRLPMSRLPNELTFDELIVTINRMFKRSDQLVLKYLDEDQDLVSLENDGDISHALNINTTFKIHAFTDKIKEIPTRPELLFAKANDSSDIKEILGMVQSTLEKLLIKESKVETEKESFAPVNYSQFEPSQQVATNPSYSYQNAQRSQTPIQPIQTPITQQTQIQPLNQPMQPAMNQQSQINQQPQMSQQGPINQQMNQIHPGTPATQQPQATTQAYSQWSPQDSGYQPHYYQTQPRSRPFSGSYPPLQNPHLPAPAVHQQNPSHQLPPPIQFR
ncbi:hypothetical protein HDV01_002653 [Terramyces sp. JEL0728]|nr:hypothetical protein HDV01_002653 [Terramyces sp. JEL0728]